MKLVRGRGQPGAVLSRPSRGAWIEIGQGAEIAPIENCRAPHGARGLKSPSLVLQMRLDYVAPLTGRVD